jgi:hypothetical protein
VKLLCLAISSPRSHVNERRRDTGSLRTCRLSADTTAAVSLLGTLTKMVNANVVPPGLRWDCCWCLLAERPPNDREWRGLPLLQVFPEWRWHRRSDLGTVRQPKGREYRLIASTSGNREPACAGSIKFIAKEGLVLNVPSSRQDLQRVSRSPTLETDSYVCTASNRRRFEALGARSSYRAK